MNNLDFTLVRTDFPDRWDRAKTQAHDAMIERTDWDSWLVCFADGGDTWEVSLRRDGDDWQGDCRAPDDSDREHDRCPGHAYHNGPCAHLSALRFAHWLNTEGFERITDTHGREIHVLDINEVQQERHDHAIEQSVRADGGEPRW
jgi:hypothetical protein